MALRNTLLDSRPVRGIVTLWHWCLSNRWRVWIALLLVLGAPAGVSAWLLTTRERRTQRDQLLANTWRKFDQTVAADDFATAEDLLTRLADFTRDPAVRARLETLRRGESD